MSYVIVIVYLLVIINYFAALDKIDHSTVLLYFTATYCLSGWDCTDMIVFNLIVVARVLSAITLLQVSTVFHLVFHRDLILMPSYC